MIAWTKHLLLVLSFISFYGCSSMTLKVDSQPPGAEVYSLNNKKLKKLGVTPLNIEDSQIEGESLQLVIKKQGYEPYSVFFEKRALTTKAEIFAQLDAGGSRRGIASVDDAQINKKLDKVSRTIASIQSQLIKQNYASAENLAQNLVNEYPYFAVGWNLLGNTYYLQNRQQEALSAYYKAMEFDPDNIETQNLIERIENRPSRSDR